MGAGLAAAILDGDLREQAQLGVLGLGAVSAVGLAATVNLDAMRAALLLTRSAANEIAALVVFAALMLTLALSDAPLWALIAASGSIPLLSGTVNLVARRRLGLPFRLRAGRLPARAGPGPGAHRGLAAADRGLDAGHLRPGPGGAGPVRLARVDRPVRGPGARAQRDLRAEPVGGRDHPAGGRHA